MSDISDIISLKADRSFRYHLDSFLGLIVAIEILKLSFLKNNYGSCLFHEIKHQLIFES